jgi:hypothetical protein
MAASQYSETFPDTNLQNQDDFFPDFEGKDDDSYLLILQSPTKAPIISKKFHRERFLTVHLSTGHLKCATTLNFVFVHVQFIPNHGGENMRYQFMMIMDAGELP